MCSEQNPGFGDFLCLFFFQEDERDQSKEENKDKEKEEEKKDDKIEEDVTEAVQDLVEQTVEVNAEKLVEAQAEEAAETHAVEEMRLEANLNETQETIDMHEVLSTPYRPGSFSPMSNTRRLCASFCGELFPAKTIVCTMR